MKVTVRLFLVASVVGLGVWGLLRHLEAQAVGKQVSEEEMRRVESVFIRNWEELLKNPDVLGVLPSPSTGEIIIETDRPEGVPTEVERVPVKTQNPNKLPPPPGVIVLQPGGVVERREDLDACPEGFEEHTRYRWRFCQPTDGNPEPFPPLMNRPIAGIPFEEALKIYEHHKDWLFALPGVTSVGLAGDGIEVTTDQPALVPGDVDGLPIKTEPPNKDAINVGSSHTGTTQVRPVHGSVLISDPDWGGLGGTATLAAAVISQGKAWGILNAHSLLDCDV